MTTANDNEAAARRLFEEVWGNHNYDVIDELVAENYTLHDPSMGDAEWPGGREGYRQMAEMGSEVIDGEFDIGQVLSVDDHVVVRWKQTGTHVGKLGNVEPTNEEVTVTGIEIDRFEDGKLAETWQEVGLLPMLMQVGAVPEDIFSEEMAADD